MQKCERVILLVTVAAILLGCAPAPAAEQEGAYGRLDPTMLAAALRARGMT